MAAALEPITTKSVSAAFQSAPPLAHEPSKGETSKRFDVLSEAKQVEAMLSDVLKTWPKMETSRRT